MQVHFSMITVFLLLLAAAVQAGGPISSRHSRRSYQPYRPRFRKKSALERGFENQRRPLQFSDFRSNEPSGDSHHSYDPVKLPTKSILREPKVLSLGKREYAVSKANEEFLRVNGQRRSHFNRLQKKYEDEFDNLQAANVPSDKRVRFSLNE